MVDTLHCANVIMEQTRYSAARRPVARHRDQAGQAPSYLSPSGYGTNAKFTRAIVTDTIVAASSHPPSTSLGQ